MTEHDRQPETPTSGSSPGLPGASRFASLEPPARLAAIGSAVTGGAALLAFATGGLHSGPILLVVAAAALALLFGVVGGALRPAARAGLLLVAAAIVVALAAFDLAWGLRHMDDPADVGGAIGVVARIGALVGAAVLGVGAVRLRTTSPAVTETGTSSIAATPRRLAMSGAVLVVVGWALMLTVGDGWALVTDQAIGVTAAVALGGLLLLLGGGAIQLRPTVETALVAGLAAVAVVMALNSILNIADEWSFVVEFGGPTTFVPYLVYLAGVAAIAAAGIMVAMRLRSAQPG